MQALIDANWRQPPNIPPVHFKDPDLHPMLRSSSSWIQLPLPLPWMWRNKVASAAFFIWSVSKLVAPKSIRFPSKLAISGGLEASVLPQQRVDWKGGKLKNSGASIRKILFLCIGFETIAAITVFDSSGCWVWATLGRPYACCQKDKHFAKDFCSFSQTIGRYRTPKINKWPSSPPLRNRINLRCSIIFRKLPWLYIIILLENHWFETDIISIKCTEKHHLGEGWLHPRHTCFWAYLGLHTVESGKVYHIRQDSTAVLPWK